MATNGNVNFQEGHVDQNTSQNSNSGSHLGKDEVGWYFVEQFYNTLSRSPDKLHLFYGKQSQFVYGVEAEVTNVSVGRQSIQERIKNLEFQDCKVRVTNVDSQASHDNIVIQVIGELSNKSLEPKKFVQTFVLAQQPSGYFVLNDIMRYIDEEVEEDQEAVPEAEAAPATTEPAAAAPVEGHAEPEPTPAKVEEPAKAAEPAPLDTEAVDQKLEDVSSAATEAAPTTTETSAESAAVAEAAAVKTKEAAQPQSVDVEKATKEIAEEDVKKAERPKEPSPTPAAPRPAAVEKPAPAEPEKPKEPPKPMTWASRIAAAAGPAVKAVVPSLPKTSTSPAQTQARQPAPAAQRTPTAAAPAAETAAPAVAAPKDQNDEWQSVGADSKRQNRPTSISGAQDGGREGAMAYIKYVTDKVQTEDLRAELAQYGELAYFDVNRQKNCAFVEFKTQAGYNAAVAANPHTVNGENIVVEQRRPKANAYGGSNYSGSRGGASNRGGRGGYDGQRQGGQSGGPRTGGGSFQGQARGGGRGGSARGGARATAAAGAGSSQAAA